MACAGTPVSLYLHIFKGFISPYFLLTRHELVLIFLILILAYTYITVSVPFKFRNTSSPVVVLVKFHKLIRFHEHEVYYYLCHE
jgi:hypothetical protein